MPGQPSANYLNPQDNNQKLTSKPTMIIQEGDVFRHELAGGGGWGDPLERDPADVLRDVRNELVSITSAKNDYGVIIDNELIKVDSNKTNALRKTMREKRAGAKLPFVAWDDHGTETALEAAK